MRDWRAIHSPLAVEQLLPGVLRVSETVVAPAERSFFYLLQGDDADILVDGGWGFASLETVRPDPGKPLLAVATHSHYDHIGLLHLSSERFGHSAEAPVYADPTPWMTQALPHLDGLPSLADGQVIDHGSILQHACPLTRIVDDGDRIEAGGISLDVLHTPGHSPGSICLIDRKHGLLFSGDTVHDGYIWDDIPGADRTTLLASHRRLASLDFARACPGHGAVLDRAAFVERIERHRRDTTVTVTA